MESVSINANTSSVQSVPSVPTPVPTCVPTVQSVPLTETVPSIPPLPSIDSSKIIVISMGSLFVRMGRTSDSLPLTIYNVIARRNKSSKVSSVEDSYLMPSLKFDKELNKNLLEMQTIVSNNLNLYLNSCGKMRAPISKEKLIDFNKRSKPVFVPKSNSSVRQWIYGSANKSVIIGEDVLLLKPTEPYHIRWPIRRGQLNINSNICGSLTSVLSDLETIWSIVIEKNLEIPLNCLDQYKVVLIIPDVYNRNHVKCLIDLLLNNLHFESCIVIHEAICATFGAGLSHACVVDVGDQKTSVCCVEDGFSSRTARLSLDYGGSDVTQLFYYLLKQRAFPYTECKSESRLGGILLQELKEKCCHFNLDICGPQEKQFVVRIPEQPVVNYTFLVGEECVIAPLAFFYPELFSVTCNNIKKIRTLNRNDGHFEDPFDENYLILTKRKYGESNETAGQTNESGINEQTGDIDDDVIACDASLNVKEINSEQQLLAIDQAILQCIDQCDSDDIKRRMYSCILLVGGGFSFTGIENWLQNRLSHQIPSQYRNQAIEIIAKPKDMDPRIVTWKGATVMSLLDSAQDMWINQNEWQSIGIRILREKASFVF